ncbi:MAG: hypothetical protein KAK00_00780 [Nanoarchaeota archaeon]|nr:hypothetical protein [Nanoarchaeota archaeon]
MTVIKEEIENYSSIALIMPRVNYIKNMITISKQLADSYNRICYVSLNQRYQPLKRSLIANKVDINKFNFIDGITKTSVSETGEVSNCVFVSAPDKLTELAIAIQKTINEQKSEVILFDSLSTLLLYEPVHVISRFVHSIIGPIGAANCMAIFTCSEGDMEKELLKDISMFIDEEIQFD